MKRIKNYKTFIESQDNITHNEGWIGDALKSASGTFKNFLTNIGAPFKNLVNDFKKGMKIEDVKNKISQNYMVEIRLFSRNYGFLKVKIKNKI